MKYFLDTEFIEHAGGIDLVSIGIVSQDGRQFYAESSEFDPRDASDWVRANVLTHLRYWGKWRNEPSPVLFQIMDFTQEGKSDHRVECVYGTEAHIKQGLLNFFGYDNQGTDRLPVLPSANIEIYAYYTDYDWVVFCRLFGRMIDLPKNMPMWCIDLKQMMWERQLDGEWKRENCPGPAVEHNALIDARWNWKLYNKICNEGVKEDYTNFPKPA